jgi:hypothetical protein
MHTNNNPVIWAGKDNTVVFRVGVSTFRQMTVYNVLSASVNA